MSVVEEKEIVPQGHKVVLNSGGMDSFFVTRTLSKANTATHVYVNVQHPYAEKEIAAVQRVGRQLEFNPIVALGAHIGGRETESGIIPFRNAELILTAAQYGTDIYLGILKDEINSDKSAEFLRAMENVLNISYRKQYWTEGRHFRLHTPLFHKTKVQLVAELFEYCDKNPENPAWIAMLMTVSCYSGEKEFRHCGRCPSCFKRWVALTVGTGFPLMEQHFDRDPRRWRPLEFWLQKKYPKEREQEIKKAYALTK